MLTKEKTAQLAEELARRTPAIKKNVDALPRYTIEEVRQHDTPEDCWIVLDKHVYAVPHSWMNKHPGGPKTIAGVAGRDATDPFREFHPTYVFKTLQPYHIGELVGYEEDEIKVAFKELSDEVWMRGYHETDYMFYVKMAAWCLSLFVLAAFMITQFREQPWVQIIGGVVLGFFWQQIAFIGHDAGHNGVSHVRAIDYFLGYFVGASFTGISIGWWKSTHNRHHVTTNSVNADPDIQHMPVLAITSKLFKSLYSTYHERVMPFDAVARFFVQFQHFSFYPIMMVARFNLYAQSLMFLLNPALPVQSRYTDLAGSCFFFAWFSYLLSFCDSWGTLLAVLLGSHAVAGLLHVQIILSHFAMETYEGIRYRNDNEDFLRTQLATSMDIDCDPSMDWFHGGLQFQLEHHLFPRVSRHHLRKVRSMLIDFCNHWGLDRYELSFVDANIKTYETLKEAASQVDDYSNHKKDDSDEDGASGKHRHTFGELLSDGLNARG